MYDLIKNAVSTSRDVIIFEKVGVILIFPKTLDSVGETLQVKSGKSQQNLMMFF